MQSLENFNKVQNKPTSDYECPVCYLIISRPALTPCKHLFCIDCINKVIELTKQCPCCRGSLIGFEPVIDLNLQETIKNKFPLEYAQREKIHEEDDKIKARMIKKKLVYGNTHSLLEGGKKLSYASENNHLWKAYVELDEDEPASKYIRKVTFVLHPTFRDREVHCTKEPFAVERIGWGTFDIQILVHFHDWLKKAPLDLTHYLSFRNNGASQNLTFEIDSELLKENNKE